MDIEIKDMVTKIQNREIAYLDLNVELGKQDLTGEKLVAISKNYAYVLKSKDDQKFIISSIYDGRTLSYTSINAFVKGQLPFYYLESGDIYSKQHKKLCSISSSLMRALLRSEKYSYEDRYLYFDPNSSTRIIFLYFPEGVYLFTNEYAFTRELLYCQINYFPQTFNVDDVIQEKLRSVKTLEEMAVFLYSNILQRRI
jgi:hypothetical protein